MDAPFQILYKNVQSPGNIDGIVRSKTSRLLSQHQDITGGHVIVRMPGHCRCKGNDNYVTVEMDVTGRKLVVSNNSGVNSRQDEVRAAILDAFLAMERQLEDSSRRRSNNSDLLASEIFGRVRDKFAELGYGFITGSDGRVVYFHENSVMQPGFCKLEIGRPVRAILARGESPVGPHATTVERVSEKQFWLGGVD